MKFLPIDPEQENELSFMLNKFALSKTRTQYFDVEEVEYLTDYFIQNEQLLKAREILDIGKQIHPYSVDISLKRAEYLMACGRLNRCMSLLQKIEAINRNNTDVLMLKAAIHSRNSEHEKSIECLQQALELEDEEEKQDILHDMAMEYESLGKFDDAINILCDALLKNPENDALAYELIYCYSASDSIEKGVEFFSFFINEHPYSFQGWYNLAICYSKLGLFEKAAQAFDYCTVIEPDLSLAYFQKAFMYTEAEEYQKAIETYKICLEVDENNAMVYCYIGECYEKLGQYDIALQYYHKSLEENEDLAEAWLGIGIIRDLKGETILALPYLEKAAKLEEDNPDYKMILAEAQGKIGDVEKCVELYQEALKICPSHEDGVLEYIAVIETEYGVDQALSELEVFMEQNENSSRLKYKMSVLQFQTGLTQSAMETFVNAMDKDPNGYKEFLSQLPYGENHSLLNELIDLHKR